MGLFPKIAIRDIEDSKRFAMVLQTILDKLSDLFSNVRPRQVIELDLAVGAVVADSFPKSVRAPKFRPLGVTICRFRNTTNPTATPVSQPFAHWDLSETGELRLLNVTGLESNTTYSIALEAFQ